MKKIKVFFRKINRNLLLYSIILMTTLVVTHLVLKPFYLKFRQWVYLTVVAVLTILILICLIQSFIKKSKKIKLIIGYICAILLAVGIVFWKTVVFMLFLLIVAINPKSERIVEIQGNKYVASVQSRLSDRTVYYYNYVNFFIMGSKVQFTENYDGSYDPIINQKEEENIGSKEEIGIDKRTQIEIVSSENILYKKEVRTGTTIRIVDEGRILGGRMLINVQKTTDGGETWSNQIENLDKCITVNYGAKFVFFNEKVGFINNMNLFILGEENNSLLVTVDGGKSFKSANFIFPLDIKDTSFYISDLPYLENEKMKVILFSPATIRSEEGNYYEFSSVDNGLNWVYSK